MIQGSSRRNLRGGLAAVAAGSTVAGGRPLAAQTARAATPARPANEPFGHSLNTSTLRGHQLDIVAEIALAAKVGYHAIEPCPTLSISIGRQKSALIICARLCVFLRISSPLRALPLLATTRRAANCSRIRRMLYLSESDHLTGFDRTERTKRRGCQKLQIRKAVGRSAQNEDRNPSTAEILLVRNLLVGGDHDLEIGVFGRSQQRAILQACQLSVRRRLAVMFGKRDPQLLVNALIQEDLHQTIGASNPGETKFLAFLQNLYRKFPADRGEAFQKLIERFAILDVIEKRLHRYTCPAKYRRPMHHFRVACDDFLHDPLSRRSRNWR